MSSFELWMKNQFKFEGIKLEETSLNQEIGSEYWHSTIFDKFNKPIAGGFSKNRDDARKIACIETISGVTKELKFNLSSCSNSPLQLRPSLAFKIR
jgi:hypothetical protein